MSAFIRRRIVVDGRVQGVGYRESCARRARSVGVSGSVCNLRDGSVEAVFEGPRDAVEELITWCRRGPRAARVRTVRVSEEAPLEQRGFRVE